MAEMPRIEIGEMSHGFGLLCQLAQDSYERGDAYTYARVRVLMREHPVHGRAQWPEVEDLIREIRESGDLD